MKLGSYLLEPTLRGVAVAGLGLSTLLAVQLPQTAHAGNGGHEKARFIQAPALGEPDIVWVTPDGGTHRLRAIPSEDLAARSGHLGPAKTIEAPNDLVPLVDPRRRADVSSQGADVSACWTYEWSRGFKNGALTGYGWEGWCGSGGWITWTGGGDCSGESWWPSYHYFGCSKQETYGVGWNVVDLRVEWRLCFLWLGWEGGCMWNATARDKLRFGATGGVWFLSRSGP